jgi:hypothetical protein
MKILAGKLNAVTCIFINIRGEAMVIGSCNEIGLPANHIEKIWPEFAMIHVWHMKQLVVWQ